MLNKNIILPTLAALTTTMIASKVEAATIPVVIHLYITDDQSDMITWNPYVLHELLTKINAYMKNDLSQCMVDVPQEWKKLVTPTDVQFAMAKRTPQGVAFEGIVGHRVPSGYQTLPYALATNEEFVKLFEFPKDQYYNIVFAPMDVPEIVAAVIDEDILPGHEYLLFNTRNSLLTQDFEIIDGLSRLDIMAALITHEIFHAFGDNKHLWGDTNQNENFNATCSEDDGLVSTPTQAEPTSTLYKIPPKFDACQKEGSLGKMYMNFMDYSQAICMATNEQVDKIWKDLTGPKSGLLMSPAFNPGTCYYDEHEPNDISSQAFEIDLELEDGYFETLATLCKGEVHDHYQFEVPPGKPYFRIRLDDLPADYDMELVSYEEGEEWTWAISYTDGLVGEEIIIDATTEGQGVPPPYFVLRVFSIKDGWDDLRPYFLSIENSSKPF